MRQDQEGMKVVTWWLPEAILIAVDDYRRDRKHHPDAIPSVVEAARQLLSEALRAAGHLPKK